MVLRLRHVEGPPGVLPALTVSRARTARRILLDRWASRLVVLGGIVIIASILAILFVILAENGEGRLEQPAPHAQRWSRCSLVALGNALGDPRLHFPLVPGAQPLAYWHGLREAAIGHLAVNLGPAKAGLLEDSGEP